ncbi:MAG: hypothetical protein HY846_06730 [Nitrosomonadales bacterium]|nr:hypothetical protein [Nitrosomonadales bacterium]
MISALAYRHRDKLSNHNRASCQITSGKPAAKSINCAEFKEPNPNKGGFALLFDHMEIAAHAYIGVRILKNPIGLRIARNPDKVAAKIIGV